MLLKQGHLKKGADSVNCLLIWFSCSRGMKGSSDLDALVREPFEEQKFLQAELYRVFKRQRIGGQKDFSDLGVADPVSLFLQKNAACLRICQPDM